MQNLFVVHSPFQKFVAELMVSNDPEFSGQDNHLLIESDHPGCRPRKPELWSGVHELETIGHSVVGRAHHLAAERNAARVHALRNGKACRILVSDIAWPINNRLFFDGDLRRTCEFRIFIDGIGSYMGARFTPALQARNTAKFLLGLTGRGVRYTPYGGTVMGGHHPRVRKVHGFSARLLSCPPQKQVEIPFVPPATLRQGAGCLFLDQSYWRHCPADQYQALRARTRDYVLSLGCERTFYKRHPLGHADDERFYADSGFEVVTDDRCVEELFHDLGASMVVSYNSSALFNIKTFYGERVRCIAFLSDLTARLSHADEAGLRRLRELFETVGVELVDD